MRLESLKKIPRKFCWFLIGLLIMASTRNVPAQKLNEGFALQQASAANAYAGFDAGEIAPETPLRRLRIVMAPSMLSSNALHTLLAAQQDPESEQYHRWLSPAQYGARFGADEGRIAKVVSWLLRSGMSDVEVAKGGNFVAFNASVAQIEPALRVKLHRYRVRGVEHYANTKSPVLPVDLCGIVSSIEGLDDFAPQVQQRRSIPAYVTGAGAVESLGPGDLATIYDLKPLYEQGVNGHGTSIAVVGAAVPSIADYRSYRSLFGLPQNDFETVIVPGSAAVNSVGTVLEAALDLEVAGGIAPGAKLIYVQDEDVLSAVAYVIDHRLADVVTMSYTNCELPGPEDLAYETLALQGAAEGITWINASGDSGPAGCDVAGASAAMRGLAVNLPASVPEVTGVGGTMFVNTSAQSWAATNASGGVTATSYAPETAWNGQTDGESMTASGGGASKDFFKPAYQSSIADAVTAREIPDVAMAAEEATHPYAIIVGGQTLFEGGTSGAAPLFAGIIALANAYQVSQRVVTTSGLGNINPVLYRLQQTAPEVFHDVTTGTNDVSCVIGSPDCWTGMLGYAAGPGYDMVTGLGSVDGYRLAVDWSGATFTSSTTTLSVDAVAADGSVKATALVGTSGNAGPGTVIFSWTNSSYLNTPTVFARVAADADGRASATGNGLPDGSNLITAEFQGTTDVLGSVSQPAAVRVERTGNPTATVSLVETETEVASGINIPLNATVTGTNTAPTGAVSFFLGNSLIGTAPVVAGSAATLSTTPPPQGAALLTAHYSGDGTYASVVSAGIPMQVGILEATGPRPASVQLRASPSSISYGSAVSLDAAVTGAGTHATGTVTFYMGQKALGPSVPLVSGIASGSYSTLPVGSEAITASYSGDAVNQAAVSTVVDVVVSGPSGSANNFTLTVPASITVAAGNGGSLPISVSPLGGFSGTIQFTCSGAVRGYGCSVPATVKVTGATTVMASLVTQAAAFVMFLPAFLLGMSGRRRRKLISATGMAGMMLLAGCGLTVNKAASTAASGTYPLTITATSGTIVHTAVVNVIVE